MAGRQGAVVFSLLAAVLLGACLPAPAAAVVHLSTLPKALAVTASAKPAQVVHAGVDTLTVTWSLNTTEPAGADNAYKNVKVSLCYAPASQKDRGWRKSNDDLSKDKSCQFKLTQQAGAAFDVAGITGIHASIKVAAGVFSAFSVAALAFFFVVENRKKNK
ncbi:High-affinity nitrate transporter-activating protein 2.1 [Dichanthelium oligosanthes]|uniref:High-affinity nitrate transporter-activating protein 2.1 n=1 Tax=Dichanthelium oligosanthes TaxID=888268 RepID=A0A1E5WKX2_9POAL|nr:High-affinity nitrate transporter-activating protein 2.1 [Dichanthelium oligosanthes]